MPNVPWIFNSTGAFGEAATLDPTVDSITHALQYVVQTPTFDAPDFTSTSTPSSAKTREVKVTGDTNNRYEQTAGGQMSWGPGNAALDVVLSRISANVLGLASGDSFTADTITGGTVTASTVLNATGAGTGLAVTNNETIGGNLGVTGVTTLTALTATSGGFSGAVTATGAGTGLAVTNNETVGGALDVTGTLTVGSGSFATAASIGTTTANAAGSATTFARSDHVHKVKVSRVQTRLTTGDLTLNSTAWANITASALDLTLPAVAGDLIVAGLYGLSANEAVTLYADYFTTTGSHYFVSAGSTSDAGIGLIGVSGAFLAASSQFGYTVVSGDLSGGNIVIRPRYRTSAAANKTLYASNTVAPLVAWAVNLGQ